ncbi:uncharacterized protein [Littorina saxatilis]
MCFGNMTPVTVLVTLTGALLWYNSLTSAANQGDPRQDIPDARYPDDNITDTDNDDDLHQSTPTFNKSPVSNRTEEVYLGSAASKNGQRYQVFNKPCEAGHPCGQDQWCSPKKRCRPCSDLQNWCNQTFIIHQNYTTCEDYCYRFEIGKTQECKAAYQTAEKRIEQVTLELRDTESALDNVTREAEKERAESTRLIAQLKRQLQDRDDDYNKQATELKGVQADLVRCRENNDRCQEQKEETRDTAHGLQVGIALCVVIAAVTTGLAIKFKLDLRRHLKVRNHGTNNAAVNQQDNDRLLVISTSSELAAIMEVKSPVQANRQSTHFGSEEDQLCLLRDQRPVAARVPGDSEFAPT